VETGYNYLSVAVETMWILIPDKLVGSVFLLVVWSSGTTPSWFFSLAT
jgi:hypothetical protein